MRNRLPTQSDSLHKFQTPWEAWENVSIDFKSLVLHFRTVDSLVYIYVPKTLRKKFDPKAMKAVFLGYSRTKKAYLGQLLDNGRIVYFELGYFDETSFPFIVGVKEKWFLDQLAGPADFEAGPSDQDILLRQRILAPQL